MEEFDCPGFGDVESCDSSDRTSTDDFTLDLLGGCNGTVVYRLAFLFVLVKNHDFVDCAMMQVVDGCEVQLSTFVGDFGMSVLHWVNSVTVVPIKFAGCPFILVRCDEQPERSCNLLAGLTFGLLEGEDGSASNVNSLFIFGESDISPGVAVDSFDAEFFLGVVVPYAIREVNFRFVRVWVENRCQHQSTAPHELSVDVVSLQLLWEVEDQGGHHRRTGFVGLPEQSVQVREESVPKFEGRSGRFSDLVAHERWVLVFFVNVIVISHEWIEGTELLPSDAHFFFRIIEEAAHISSNHGHRVQSEVQKGRHGHFQVFPRWVDVAVPVSTVDALTSGGRAWNYEWPLASNPLQRLESHLGLVEREQIVEVVVAAQVVLGLEAHCLVENWVPLTQSVGRVVVVGISEVLRTVAFFFGPESGRFVHVDPQAVEFQDIVELGQVFDPPISSFGVREVRENGVAITLITFKVPNFASPRFGRIGRVFDEDVQCVSFVQRFVSSFRFRCWNWRVQNWNEVKSLGVN